MSASQLAAGKVHASILPSIAVYCTAGNEFPRSVEEAMDAMENPQQGEALSTSLLDMDAALTSERACT